MDIHYNRKKLVDILYDFYTATGVNISVNNTDFSPIAKLPEIYNNTYCCYIQNTPEGKCACTHSDKSLFDTCRKSKRAEMRVCHAGLMDIAIPIIYSDVIVAYVIMGQMKVTTAFSEIEAYITSLGLDSREQREIYDRIPFFNEEKLQAIAKLAVMLTSYILLENMVTPSLNENIKNAEQFIGENLQKELTILDISKGTNISKSVLYKNFRISFDCTVKEYINRKRVEKSEDLLVNTDLSVEEISQMVGFSSASYYSKIFRKYKGVSPLKLRKTNTKKS